MLRYGKVMQSAKVAPAKINGWKKIFPSWHLGSCYVGLWSVAEWERWLGWPGWLHVERQETTLERRQKIERRMDTVQLLFSESKSPQSY